MPNGAEILVKCLERAGIDLVFAYPGATSLRIHQALHNSNIRVVLPRHEQGAAFAACGFARRSGKTGVCIATSGPGSTNLLTGIADAWMDSTPLLAITAQVRQDIIGKNAFQETDIIGMTRPIVKHSFLVFSPEEIPETVNDAFALASSGRPGPVIIDIPWDVLAKTCEPSYPSMPNLRAMSLPPELKDEDFQKFCSMLVASRKPCIFAGGGVLHSNASKELQAFAEAWKIPVTTSLMGIGAFPREHRLSLGWIGMHGTYGGNKTVDECDLLIAMGVRFSDRVTGNPAKFAPHAQIIHIDIDDSEINKNKHADLPLVGDVKEILAKILKRHPYTRGRKEWLAQVKQWKGQHEFSASKPSARGLHAPTIIKHLAFIAGGADATLVTGVGQHQMWAAQFCRYQGPRKFITSGGLGAMGFGLPAAIGVQLARPDETVILIDGDGSFQMNIQELATVFAEKLPIKMVIINNQRLGMVAQVEDRFFNGVHGNTDLHVPSSKRTYPDFVTIAKGYGIPGRKVSSFSQWELAVKDMMFSSGPFLIDCVVSDNDQVLPLIPQGKNFDEIIL